MVATPVDYSRTVVQPRSLAPELGQHTEEVLAELAAHNDALKRNGAQKTN